MAVDSLGPHQREQTEIKNSAPREHDFSRDTVLIAVFGALWGLMEATLGVFLKGLRIPMGGAILTAMATIILLTGRYYVRRRGSVLMMGAVAAVLKLFSIGTVIAGPFMAILLEALFAEIIISILGVNRFSYILTGMFLMLYTIVHPFIAQGLIFGDDIYTVYLETFRKAAQLLKLQANHLGLVLALYGGIHALFGSVAGWLGYRLPEKVSREMQQTEKSAEELS